MEVSVGLLVNREWNGGSDLQAGVEIYTIGSTPNFGSFRAAKMTPFWDPNFNPPCGQLAVPYVFAHREHGPNSTLYTQKEVLGPASYPVSHWPCPGRASHT